MFSQSAAPRIIWSTRPKEAMYVTSLSFASFAVFFPPSFYSLTSCFYMCPSVCLSNIEELNSCFLCCESASVVLRRNEELGHFSRIIFGETAETMWSISSSPLFFSEKQMKVSFYRSWFQALSWTLATFSLNVAPWIRSTTRPAGETWVTLRKSSCRLRLPPSPSPSSMSVTCSCGVFLWLLPQTLNIETIHDVRKMEQRPSSMQGVLLKRGTSSLCGVMVYCLLSPGSDVTTPLPLP